MKMSITQILAAVMLLVLTACAETTDINPLQSQPIGASVSETHSQNIEDGNSSSETGRNENGDEENEMINISVKVGETELTAKLLNNETTRSFAAKLPLTLSMEDLYSREMCYRFEEALPTDNVQTTGYEVGEIIYWPPGNAFVIMYAQNGEQFGMQKLGRIDSGVEIFENTGDVDVTFELVN